MIRVASQTNVISINVQLRSSSFDAYSGSVPAKLAVVGLSKGVNVPKTGRI